MYHRNQLRLGITKAAHDCELNIPFNKTRSLSVMDTVIKSMQYYTLENWFIKSTNPQIPHNVNLASLLQRIQTKTQNGGYPTDWDFNTAVTDAVGKEQDGHTVFQPYCTTAFSYNLPFSVATLANSPTSSSSCPYLLTNYDFPLSGRSTLEAYYKGLGFIARKYDGLELTLINGVDAATYLVDLADASSLSDGLFGAYESLQTRYMRLMSRYSADAYPGNFTQEVGKFAQRGYYPGAESITLTVALKNGNQETVSHTDCDVTKQ